MLLYDLPYEEYRNNPALGSTDLKNLLKSPAHFRHERLNPGSSKAKDQGSVVHAYLLERPTFFERYAVEPEGLLHKGRNPWKKDWDDFKKMAEDSGKIVVERETWLMAKGIRDSILEHPWAKKIYQQGDYEVSAFHDGLKARADILHEHFIADVKTCEDAQAFKWSVRDYRYDVQAAAYSHVFEGITGKPRDFVWIVCEKKPPYCVKVIMCSEERFERGKRDMNIAKEIYQRCVDTNTWPGYDTDIEEI